MYILISEARSVFRGDIGEVVLKCPELYWQYRSKMLGWIKWYLFPENSMGLQHRFSFLGFLWWDYSDYTKITWWFVGATLDKAKSASHAPSQSARSCRWEGQVWTMKSPEPWGKDLTVKTLQTKHHWSLCSPCCQDSSAALSDFLHAIPGSGIPIPKDIHNAPLDFVSFTPQSPSTKCWACELSDKSAEVPLRFSYSSVEVVGVFSKYIWTSVAGSKKWVNEPQVG